ncbi:uncharacterized protein METZ01_LOCUS458280 [marine metagenome]|uniref:Uncharacterized protein n=1 Tax=marine metagenome TaxID=408172 RepID=A0A383AC33_9ZZZZ
MVIKMKSAPIFALVLLSLASLLVFLAPACFRGSEKTYYPLPDSGGGWRILDDPATILDTTGVGCPS